MRRSIITVLALFVWPSTMHLSVMTLQLKGMKLLSGVGTVTSNYPVNTMLLFPMNWKEGLLCCVKIYKSIVLKPNQLLIYPCRLMCFVIRQLSLYHRQ